MSFQCVHSVLQSKFHNVFSQATEEILDSPANTFHSSAGQREPMLKNAANILAYGQLCGDNFLTDDQCGKAQPTVAGIIHGQVILDCLGKQAGKPWW